MTQDQRRVSGCQTVRFTCAVHVGRRRIRPRRAGPNPFGQIALVCAEANEEGANRGDAPTAAHHVREGDHVRGELQLHREAVQNVQGPQVPVHADGELPGRRAVDHFTGQGPLR